MTTNGKALTLDQVKAALASPKPKPLETSIGTLYTIDRGAIDRARLMAWRSSGEWDASNPEHMKDWMCQLASVYWCDENGTAMVESPEQVAETFANGGGMILDALASQAQSVAGMDRETAEADEGN